MAWPRVRSRSPFNITARPKSKIDKKVCIRNLKSLILCRDTLCCVPDCWEQLKLPSKLCMKNRNETRPEFFGGAACPVGSGHRSLDVAQISGPRRFPLNNDTGNDRRKHMCALLHSTYIQLYNSIPSAECCAASRRTQDATVSVAWHAVRFRLVQQRLGFCRINSLPVAWPNWRLNVRLPFAWQDTFQPCGPPLRPTFN